MNDLAGGWELAAWGGAADFEIRRRPDGRWIMRFVAGRERGPQGNPEGYVSREAAARDAARYASM